ncbi:hypothetical protein EDD22DRAFT_867048 [Suillus occidentalis]|nr:hypothetical protein EDD22DRAFT_867048 [Suillus occidentalis]
MHTDILRALAFMIYKMGMEIDSENVLAKIKTLIGGPIALLATLAETLDAHNATLENTITEVRDNINSSAEGLGKAVENAAATANAQRQFHSNGSGSDGPKTSAMAAKTNIPSLIKGAKCEQDRYSLIGAHRYTPTPCASSQAQLVKKASLPIELMEKEDIELPIEIIFISARRLPHGGILYETDS